MAVIDAPLQRSSPSDPNRCQAVAQYGQCPNKATEGAQFCDMHRGVGGASPGPLTLNTQLNAQTRGKYNLGRWRDRVSDFADSPDIKLLREEIGVSRLVLEQIIGQCQDSHDIIINHDKIIHVIDRIEKLVTACHRMEEKTGVLLDKSKVSQILDVLLAAVTTNVDDSDVIEAISLNIQVNMCRIFPDLSLTGSQPDSNAQALAMPQDGRVNTA